VGHLAQRKPVLSAVDAIRGLRRALPLLAAGLALACSGGDARPRALVIGIDGADWRLIDPLIEAGRMPNLAALRARGAWGPIATLADIPLSPVVWTSAATGKTAARHGITWFLVDRPDGSRVPVRSTNRTAKALWNILAERGRKPVSIGWWATYPAEDVGDGVIVSDALGFHGFGRTARAGDADRKVHPPGRFEALDALVPPEQQVTADFATRFLHLSPDEYRERAYDPARHPRRDPSNRVHLFQQYAVTAQGYTAIAEALLDEPWDVLLVYYEQVDSFSHLFMKHAPPRLAWIDEAEFERFRDVVTEWYAYQDELLGRLLAKADLATTAVFVLSDHGFKSGERRIRSERAVDLRTAHLDHEPDGIFVAAGPGIRRGVEVAGASVVDLTPTLLHYLGLPVAKDMDGKVLTWIFDAGENDARPIEYIATYESPAGEADEPLLAEEGAWSDDEEAQVLAGLEALGYVEGSGTRAEAGASGSAPAPGDEAAESSPEIHNNLGRIHVRAGDLDEAQAEFEKALALDPRNAEALLSLASVAALRGNRGQAERLVEIALASNPDSPAALAQLAELRRDAGDLTSAIRLFREALAIHDAAPDLYLGLGDCLQRAGRNAEAEAAFERVLALLPDSVAAHYNLGVVAANLGRYDESIARYEKVLALDAQHPLAASALNNLGTVHLERGEREQAIARYEQAVQASPAQLEAHYNLAAQYLDDGRLDDAIPLLEQAARIAPNHELVHVMLARAYLEKGRAHDAYRALALVQRLYPENWFAPLGLAVLFAADGQPDRARPLLETAIRLGGRIAREQASRYPTLAPALAAIAGG
jgi:tetratricopeptide (TPR) repeat protein